MSGAMRANTIAARGAAVIVAVVAGAASFEHIASVAIGAGERTWVGYSLPFAIDGLIVVGVAALLEDKRHHRLGRLSARLAVLVGVIATLAANIASAEPTGTARLVAITAPVSFLLSVEVLTRSGRRLSTPDDTNAYTRTAPAAAGAAGPPAARAPGTTRHHRPAAADRRPAGRPGGRQDT
jgi:Ca2+/Na+ antiporter